MDIALKVLFAGLVIFWPLAMFAILTNNNRAGKIAAVGLWVSTMPVFIVFAWNLLP